MYAEFLNTSYQTVHSYSIPNKLYLRSLVFYAGLKYIFISRSRILWHMNYTVYKSSASTLVHYSVVKPRCPWTQSCFHALAGHIEGKSLKKKIKKLLVLRLYIGISGCDIQIGLKNIQMVVTEIKTRNGKSSWRIPSM